MGSFGKAIGVLLKRPMIIISFSAIMFVLCLISYYFPIFTLLFGSPFKRGDIITDIVIFIRLLIKLTIKFNRIIYIVGIVFAFSMLAGFIFAGGFRLITNTLNGIRKSGSDFIDGVKKQFVRMWFMSFVAITLTVIFMHVMLVASVPALIVTKAAIAGKSGMLLIAVLIDFITAFVMFFGFMYFTIYLAFWFPAVANGVKGGFFAGKRVADTYFWSLVVRVMFLVLIMAIGSYILIKSGNSISTFFAKWIFYTIFSGLTVSYIFSLFKNLSGKGVKQNTAAMEYDD